MKRRQVLKTLGISAAAIGTGFWAACTGQNENTGQQEIKKVDTIPTKVAEKELSERDKKIINREKQTFKDSENPTKAELKHTPEISVGTPNEAGFIEVKIVIGQKGIIHPSSPEHWIDFISLATDGKLVGKVEFEAGTASGFATFKILTQGVKVLTAVSGCNIHGIWESSISL